MCSSILCDDNFLHIYEKFDKFGEKMISILNKTNIDLSHELKKIVDKSSLDLMIKTKISIQKISHQHARMEANSRVLTHLLESPQEFETRHINRGLNIYTFILLCIVFACIGINFEIIRLRSMRMRRN
jgi:hypothetical protein